MFRTKLMLLSLVGVVSAFALLASSASASIKFEWKVGGKLLAAGETKAFTATSDGKTFTFNSELLGVKIKLLSPEIAVESGAVIKGGKPGTNAETVLFKNVTVAEPTGCVVESPPTNTVGLVKTEPLKTEIVESDPGGEPLILFTPNSGTTFVELRFLNKGTETCAGAALGAQKITGSILAEPLPALQELLTNDLDFEAKTKNYILSTGALDTAGLKFGTAVATLAGLALVLLATHELFGAF